MESTGYNELSTVLQKENDASTAGLESNQRLLTEGSNGLTTIENKESCETNINKDTLAVHNCVEMELENHISTEESLNKSSCKNSTNEETISKNNIDTTDILKEQPNTENESENKKRSFIESNASQSPVPNPMKRSKVELYTKDTEPQWYNVKGNLVTPTIITKNLPKIYESLPVTGRPENGDLDGFYYKKLREFVGSDIADDEFNEVARYCSTTHLKTGKELIIKSTSAQSQGILPMADIPEMNISSSKLCILKKCRMRMEKDVANNYTTKLKYRGVKLLPLNQDEVNCEDPSEPDEMLEPGKDLLFRVRIYRPYAYQMPKDRCTRSRHSVFSCSVVLAGRQALAALRDRIVCNNDVDMRVDVSHTPDVLPLTTAKEAFPSGFLFINNVFYVDKREGCKDHSAIIREWAASRGMGIFPVKDMSQVKVEDIPIKLGYPEVYVHQGGCEHVLTFSEVRLVSAGEALRVRAYPRPGAVSQHQTVYCTTCAEFGAKWVVVGSARVPFDPAFFCDTCFKQYLYIDGNKIGHFKAYSYRGNEINTLKPV